MRTVRAWVARLGGLWGSERREREIASELESHLEMHVADNVRAGMSLQQARREALMKLGSVESVKEAYRERSGAPVLDHLARDMQYALRQARKNPVFSITAVLVLALGMSAATAIFAFMDA